ncbi:MAG: type 4a pilus biogenesis protein PilO [Phycisphaerae bacterium]|nr:type 4a pilus biogenesis protein PilO [Phycisphaerae bacterium]
MRRFDKQETVLLAGVLLLAALLGVFRYLPLLRQRQALDQTIEQNRQTLEQIQTQSARLDELTAQLTHKQAQAATFDARIPTGRSFADLWRQIADLMNQCNLTDQLVQPGRAVETDHLGTIPLTLSCSGTMQDLYAFLQTIEQWDRLIRFDKIELTNDSAFGGGVKLSGTAQLYYQPDPKG